MSGETLITVIGNITSDPELRFTPGGDAVANFTIASTPRTFDRQSNEWKDGETLFLRAGIWREAAENVAESIQKGMRVIASGFLKQRSYETKEGEKRTVVELEVQEIGPSLRYATAKVARSARGGQQQGGGGFGGGQQQGGWNGQQGAPQGQQQQGWGGQPQAAQQPAQGGWGGQAAVAEDPWATPGVTNAGGQQQGGWGGQQQGQEPPF
jgi:single-strand DNA-binding protein